VEDHQAIFADPRTTVPGAAQLEGEWDGNLIFVAHPNVSLLNQANPVLFRLSFQTTGNQVEGRYRFGLLSGEMKVEFTEEFVRLVDFTAFHDEIRLIDPDTLIGKWVSPDMSPVLLAGLRNYVEPVANRLGFYYILKRAKAGAAMGGGRPHAHYGGPLRRRSEPSERTANPALNSSPCRLDAAGIRARQNPCLRSAGSHLPAGCGGEPLHRRCRDRVRRQTELRVRRRGGGRQSVCRRSRPLQSSPRHFLHGIQDIRPKSLSGKSDGCPKTLRRQPRMLGQDLVRRFSRCQLLQD